MKDCLFCQIVSGEAPAEIVHSDDLVVAFRDIRPQAPLHLLVVPRAHIASLADGADGDEGLLGHLLLVGARLAREAGIEESGYRAVINTNSAAGQTVFHLHLHILGGRWLSWPPG